MKTDDTYEPRILAFLCNWCAYAGADLAGVSRMQYPPTTRVIRTMCSGRVDPVYVVQGLQSGFDSVLICGWHMGECHYLDGNVHLSKHMQVVEHLLDLTGIGRDRMAVRWLSAAEGRLFAEYVNEFSEKTRQLGPFDPREFELVLAAAWDALNAPRLRWLMGMELQIIEKGNVYKEKIEEKEFWNLLKKAAEDEYHGALILEVLKKGALSVREIALKTGLPVYTVSLRLGELERCRKAKLKGYDGNISLFSSLATEAV